ncbi:Oaz1p Ecym_2556 [Eremothecium cymbalariae DBVPG|uniref:Uncharacterized protein n=1 Tax=Eremothecium cymbalariae (strain CBS 270.75 / DBVPG 7215 / KCTC 17166 / NRRL Y-17582) TaxID=931890 RepID=G8JQB7_ERECY|nr:Hypothetical protein Ecym_2556 [Eremothecium cymbalariae DBVPG\
MESRFLVFPNMRSGGDDAQDTRSYRVFQKHIVKRVGKKITCLTKGLSSSEDKYPDFQQIGDLYGVILEQYGMHFYKAITNNRNLLVIMDRRVHTAMDLKKWLIMIMELVGNNLEIFPHGCQWLLLFVDRSNLVNIKDLLKNLNWIGGEIVQNFGDCCTGDENPVCWNDTDFITIRFEC